MKLHDKIFSMMGERPIQLSAAEVLLEMAAARTNITCPYCQNTKDFRITIPENGEGDVYQCGTCEKKWKSAWRLIFSPVLLDGLPIDDSDLDDFRDPLAVDDEEVARLKEENNRLRISFIELVNRSKEGLSIPRKEEES